MIAAIGPGVEPTDLDAAAVFGEHLANVSTDAVVECTERDRNRIFNLGYYTWVEQQGTPFELFEERRRQSFWRGLRRYLPVWDEMIADFNGRAKMPEPTDALPGTLDKVRVLEERARLGQALWHPQDAKLDLRKLAELEVDAEVETRVLSLAS